jgi:hypothetical protein
MDAGRIIADVRARLLLALLVLTLGSRTASAATFTSPLTPEVVDQRATAEWVDGHETSRADFLPAHAKVNWKNQVTWFLAMPGAHIGSGGIMFGASTHAGPRHLRVAFVHAVPVGTVLTRGDVTRVSALRADAAAPGDLARDADWIEATHASKGELSLWVLPPGTSTRALRFTADKPESREPTSGWLLGASVLVERLANLAPDATALASSHEALARRLNDGSYDRNGGWDNDDAARAGPLSPDHPEWVMLMWPARVPLRGVGVFNPFVGKVEVQVYTGPDGLHPREADETRWRAVATSSLPNTYPDALVPSWIDFERTISTRAVRLRIVAPVADEGHYLKGLSRGGRRGALGEVMAFEALGEKAPPEPRAKDDTEHHPPIAVPFTMPEAGYVTLVIEDAQGRRVRNLVGDTWFAAGPQVVWWDGLDESGTNDGRFNAHRNHKNLGAPVAPGRYSVRGLFHGPLPLRYELSVYSPGTPPWMTGPQPEAGSGGWLADHTNPQAALFLPGPTPRMLLASPIAEGGHGLIWTDLAGRKLAGRRWVGGSWTGASHLARDGGPRAARGVSAYTGVSFQNKLRLTALPDGGEPVPIASDALAAIAAPALGGLAVRDRVLYASLPKSDVLLRVDAATGAVLGRSPLPDGRGLAFDPRGRLLALSGRRLLVYEVASTALGEPQVLVASGLEDPVGLAADLVRAPLRDGRVLAALDHLARRARSGGAAQRDGARDAVLRRRPPLPDRRVQRECRRRAVVDQRVAHARRARRAGRVARRHRVAAPPDAAVPSMLAGRRGCARAELLRLVGSERRRARRARGGHDRARLDVERDPQRASRAHHDDDDRLRARGLHGHGRASL